MDGHCEDHPPLEAVEPGLKKQFYHPLIFLTALNSPEMERRSQGGTLRRAEPEPSQIFHNFVNRVALMCQTKPGGDAVSASTVLQDPSKVVYLFTSGCRDDHQLEDVAQELTTILKMVSVEHETDDVDTPALQRAIIRAIIALVEPRVKCYLNNLAEHLEGCIASCQRERYGQGKSRLPDCFDCAELTSAQPGRPSPAGRTSQTGKIHCRGSRAYGGQRRHG